MTEPEPDSLAGKPAPQFCLPDAGGKKICLKDYGGKWIILYFYPRDNTPGCTIEALQFNAALEQFADLGAQIIGISSDSGESHRKFSDKYHLSILLLSDTGHEVIKAYGSWKPMTLLKKELLGTRRDTFLIEPAGTVVHVWRSVNPKGHAEEVRKVLLDGMKK